MTQALKTEAVEINAWTGAKAADAQFGPDSLKWTFREKPPKNPPSWLKPAEPADPANWKDDRIGWGIILKDNPGEPLTTLASGDDAPAPIRKLLAQRAGQANVSILRYRPQSQLQWTVLRNYKSGKDVDITRAAECTGPDGLPQYLLIVGSPDDVPWLQYTLNAKCSVGRLDLDEPALANYVDALLDGWSGSKADVCKPVVWSVNHAMRDITELMHNSIAAPVAAKLAADPSIGAGLKFLDSNAAVSDLKSALTANKAALVVTTSHGMTGPLGNSAQMADDLGLLVDHGQQLCRPADLIPDWEPDGAIWYAHACCSAGSDMACNFNDLVPAASSIAQVLQAVAALGSRVAPFPKSLLGASKPLRCFIGHVEPTFDWTLRQPMTGQFLTAGLVESLYEKLGRGQPVGLAFQAYFKGLGATFAAHDSAIQAFNNGKTEAQDVARVALLSARDIRSTVLLGDPLAALPPIP